MSICVISDYFSTNNRKLEACLKQLTLCRFTLYLRVVLLFMYIRCHEDQVCSRSITPSPPEKLFFLFPLFKKIFRKITLFCQLNRKTHTVCGTGIIQPNSSLNSKLHLQSELKETKKIIVIFHTYQSCSSV